METLSPVLVLKALLRVLPVFLLTRFVFEIGVGFRIFFSLPLVLILSQRLSQNYYDIKTATVGFDDALLGLSVGIFVSLLFTAISKASVFLDDNEIDTDAEDGPWKEVTHAFILVFTLMLFMALGLEKSLLEFLATDMFSTEKLRDTSLLAKVLTDLSWLAVKVSSFGLLFTLMKRMFEEVYRRLGGESFRLIFSTFAWTLLLFLSPFLIPSFADFLSAEMGSVWNQWMGGIR